MTTTAIPAVPAPPKDDPTIWQVDDALWARLEPLLTIDKPRKKRGRPRRDDRVLFDGLIWILRTGAQWAALPAEFGPKSTCHARFQEWVRAGVFQQAWALLLHEYDAAIGLEWEWQAADGCLVKAPLGKRGRRAQRKRPGATPPIAAKPAPSAMC
jgi:transposase